MWILFACALSAPSGRPTAGRLAAGPIFGQPSEILPESVPSGRSGRLGAGIPPDNKDRFVVDRVEIVLGGKISDQNVAGVENPPSDHKDQFVVDRIEIVPGDGLGQTGQLAPDKASSSGQSALDSQTDRFVVDSIEIAPSSGQLGGSPQNQFVVDRIEIVPGDRIVSGQLEEVAPNKKDQFVVDSIEIVPGDGFGQTGQLVVDEAPSSDQPVLDSQTDRLVVDSIEIVPNEAPSPDQIEEVVLITDKGSKFVVDSVEIVRNNQITPSAPTDPGRFVVDSIEIAEENVIPEIGSEPVADFNVEIGLGKHKAAPHDPNVEKNTRQFVDLSDDDEQRQSAPYEDGGVWWERD